MFNEEASIDELYTQLTSNLTALAAPDGQTNCYELIFIDDGSRDATYQRLAELAERDPRVVLIKLRKNFGQTPALAAGFDYARGEVVIAMDGDLQHDPNEIPKFAAKIHEGYDVVSGWRQRRVDGLFLRRIPSKCANWLIRKISKVDIHDFGTTFKAYRRDVLEHINLYGDNHRFIPALAQIAGATIAEVPIKNINAPYRPSNYGFERTFRVLLDLITIKFLNSYLTRPLHLFGKFALLSLAGSVVIFGYTLLDKFIGGVDIFSDQGHGPLFLLACLLFMMALAFFSTGLLAELISRVYFEAQHKSVYTVREVRRGSVVYRGDGRPAARNRHG